MSQTETPTPTGVEQATLRKLAYTLAELDGEPVDPETTPLIEAAREGLDNVQDLQERVAELEDRVTTVEQRAPDPSAKSYDEMDKSDKVTVLRSHLKQQAEGTNGRAALSYRDVIGVFEGHPSPGHAYDLMEQAATAEGFAYDTDYDGNKRVRVNLAQTRE